MDLWVVAAVAGAGYAAKNLQNLSLDKNESSFDQSLKNPLNFQSEPKNFLQQIRDKTCPLRRLDRKTAQIDDSDVKSQQTDRFSGRDSHSIASTSGNSGVESFEFENFRSSNRNKFVKRKTRQVPYAKRLNHLNSFFDAHVSGEGEKLDENLCNLFPPLSTVGPVLVTGGTGIIRKSSGCSSLVHLEEENGVSSRESKLKNCSGSEKLSESDNGGRSLDSSVPNGTLLFIIGMTIGIMSASMASKNELEELNKQLKQANNLVQDLHEELDMKEMITMKEIEPHGSPSDSKPKNSNKIGSVKENDKNIENAELMKKIEAELQAELEMLEQNMKASSLERMSSVLEIDPDFDPDIIQRDIKQMKSDSRNDSRNELSDTTTNFSQPANYSVSPFELTLRLHELIESRLEERIKELEMTLSNSQNRVQVLDSQTLLSGRRLSYSETENSSPPQSPTCIDEHDLMLENNIFTNSCDEINYGFLVPDREKKDGENGGLGFVQDMPSFMSNVDFESEDESGDESEMLLIKKIVERRRSSSNFCSTLLY